MTYPPTPENPAQPENEKPGQAETGSAAPDEQQPPAGGTPPQYAAPQNEAPQYGAPQPQTPLYSAPQYPAPDSQTPQYSAPQYSEPQYSAPQQPVQPPAPFAAPAPSAYPQQPAFAAAPAYAAGSAGTPGPGEPFDGATDPDDLSRPLYGASFGQAIRRFLKNYAGFSGRASRSEYWWTVLFSFLASLIPLAFYIAGAVMLASASAASSAYNDGFGDEFGSSSSAPAAGLGITILIVGVILLLAVGLGLLVPTIAVTWRRFHDANFAGPFYFLSFIPYVGGLVVLVFMFLPSSPLGRRFDRF